MTSSLIATSPLPGEAELTMDADSYVERWLQNPDPKPVGAAAWPPAFAARAVERLKAEADQHWYIDPNVSLKLAELIIAIGQERADRSTTALGTMAKGDALKFIGRTVEAWDALEQAGRMFQEAGDEVGWARTRIGRLWLSVSLNHVAEVLTDAESAREIFVRHNEKQLLLRLDYQATIVYSWLGEAHQALKLCESAIAIADTLGEVGQNYLGDLYMSMGMAYDALGDFRQELNCYERARAVFVARGESQNQARLIALVDIDIAYIARCQGHYRRALRLLHDVLERVNGHFPLEVALAKHNIVECYLFLNRYEDARELAQEVVTEYRDLKAEYEIARTLCNLAIAEGELGNFATAQAALEEAGAIFASLQATAWAATIRLWRGQLALRQGNMATTYEEAVAAADGFAASGRQDYLAMAALLQGQASFASGDWMAAKHSASQAMRFAQRYNVPSLRYTAHLLLGQVSEAQQMLTHAVRHYQAAAATTERVQRNLTITLRPGFLQDKDEAARRLISLYLRVGQAGKAFEALERAKSQVLLGYLVNREHLHWLQDDMRSRALIDELEHLRAEHQWFYHLAHDLPSDPNRSNVIQPQQALAEAEAREKHMRAITERLYLNSGAGRMASQVPNTSISDVQRRLSSGTVLIEFYNDGVRLWAFILDGRTLEAHPLPATAEMLDRLLSQLQVNIAAALSVAPQSPTANTLMLHGQRILQRLYHNLLHPLELHRRECERLVIVPYGALHYLPFHLLQDGTRYLIERYEVVVQPASGLMIQPSPRQPPGAVILAHSCEGRLVHVGAEAQMVQRLFGGTLYTEQAATSTALRTPPTQILHIATHGQHRLDQPDLSYLQLADGQLYADDLLQEDLSYELVTLSACETGRARVAGGDELIGLGRGLLYAGAGALLVSLWRVEDASTVVVMEQFYRALQRGASKAAALREAQLTTMNKGPRLHPAFWGAFQLVGNAQPLTHFVQ